MLNECRRLTNSSFVTGLSMLLAGFSGCTTASHPPGPESVTGSEIAGYKLGLIQGCMERTLGQGASADTAMSECNCTIQRLETAFSHEDWRLAAFAARTHQEPLHDQMLSRLRTQILACHDAVGI